MIVFACTSCGKKISAPEDYAAKRVRCPNCQQPVTVPDIQSKIDPPAPETIKFRCPHCEQKIALPTTYAGKAVTCAKCQKKFRVPRMPGQLTSSSIERDKSSHPLLDFAPSEQYTQASGETYDEPIQCLYCKTYNKPGTHFCATCGEQMPYFDSGPDSNNSTSFRKALAASIGLTCGGIALWSILAALLSLFWLQWIHCLAVGVALLAGYGLTLFNNKLTHKMGLLAILIGFVGIIIAKVIISYFILMPRMDSFWQDKALAMETEISEQMLDDALNNPDQTFNCACYHLAEEFGWDRKFTHRVTIYHTYTRISKRRKSAFKWSPEEKKQLKEAAEKVQQKIEQWSPEEKRLAMESGIKKHKEMLKQDMREAIDKMEDPNNPQPAPSEVKEVLEVLTGDRPPSDSQLGRSFAKFGACCCLDILWIPLGLFFAYKFASGSW
jgi:DNA-directed RNA polymerase subunit RPC12/RpoP